LASPRLDWPRVGLSSNCPVTANSSQQPNSQVAIHAIRLNQRHGRG